MKHVLCLQSLKHGISTDGCKQWQNHCTYYQITKEILSRREQKKIPATYIEEFSLGRLQMNSFVHKGNILKGTARNVCYKH
jgi:hypothetical protein